MSGIRAMPSERDLRRAVEAGVPLLHGDLVWPPPWLALTGERLPREPAADGDAMAADLRETLTRQVAWLQRAHKQAGGAFQRRSVTSVLTDTVFEWACSRMPSSLGSAEAQSLLKFRPQNPHGVYTEAHVPVTVAGDVKAKACDVIVIRPGAADLVIEIDRKNNRDAAAKLAVARDAGAVAVWVRWDGRRVEHPPGVHVIDLVAGTRGLAKPPPGAGTARPATPEAWETVTISEFSEVMRPLNGSGPAEGRGVRDASRIRHQAARWMAFDRAGGNGPRLAEGIAVTGHRRLEDVSAGGPGGIVPGEDVRYEVGFIRVPGNVTPVRPLVVEP